MSRLQACPHCGGDLYVVGGQVVSEADLFDMEIESRLERERERAWENLNPRWGPREP